MKQEAKISVIVPVYGVERYISDCIRSLCDQTWKNLEILLIDDGSKDGSGKICDTVVKMVETDGWRLTESGDAEETLYHMYQKPQKQKVRLHYIPYYTWANRGENEMQVWTRVQNP